LKLFKELLVYIKKDKEKAQKLAGNITKDGFSLLATSMNTCSKEIFEMTLNFVNEYATNKNIIAENKSRDGYTLLEHSLLSFPDILHQLIDFIKKNAVDKQSLAENITKIGKFSLFATAAYVKNWDHFSEIYDFVDKYARNKKKIAECVTSDGFNLLNVGIDSGNFKIFITVFFFVLAHTEKKREIAENITVAGQFSILDSAAKTENWDIFEGALMFVNNYANDKKKIAKSSTCSGFNLIATGATSGNLKIFEKLITFINDLVDEQSEFAKDRKEIASMATVKKLTILQAAAATGKVKIFNKACEFFLTAMLGDFRTAEKLILQTSTFGYTLLHTACKTNMPEVVKAVIEFSKNFDNRHGTQVLSSLLNTSKTLSKKGYSRGGGIFYPCALKEFLHGNDQLQKYNAIEINRILNFERNKLSSGIEKRTGFETHPRFFSERRPAPIQHNRQTSRRTFVSRKTRSISYFRKESGVHHKRKRHFPETHYQENKRNKPSIFKNSSHRWDGKRASEKYRSNFYRHH